MNRAADALAAWWDKDLENVVAGQVLLGSGAFDAYVAAGLEADHFQQRRCQVIWRAAARLAQAGQPVELVGVHRELHRAGEHGDAPIASLTALTDGLPWPRDVEQRRAYVRANATRLHELWTLRQTAQQLELVHGELRGIHPDSDMLRAEFDAMSERLAQPLAADDGGPESALAATLVSASTDQRGAVLGLDAIDETFGGIIPGEVCVLEARSSVGKTIVLCRSAFHTLRDVGWGVIFFSMEMTKAAIFERFYRIATGLDKWQYRSALQAGEIDQDAWLQTYPGLVLHDQQHTIADIERKIIRAKADQLAGAPGVFVILDYFGLLMGDERLSAYERTSKHARELKRLAKRQHIALLPAVQVGREAGGDGDVLLGLGAGRDSGQIEEAADKVVGLRRLDTPRAREDLKMKFKAIIFAHIMKHRQGELLKREMAYQIDWRGYQLLERPNLAPPEQTESALARRRR